MYNISGGATSKAPCLYYMAPPHTLDADQHQRKPSRAEEDANFCPVLSIPLTHVHVCTLHALCRITEKLVYLYIQFAWKLQPKPQSLEAINKIEKILSEMGLHGGHVKIVADIKRSTTSSEVPVKPYISGVKARHFFGFHGEHGKSIKDETLQQPIIIYGRNYTML